jgi:GTP-binding protein
LTKRDALKASELPVVTAATQAALEKRPAAYPTLLFTSAHGGEGVADLRAAVAKLLYQRNA